MIKKSPIHLIFCLICLSTVIMSAQPKINSPYSRYGIGEVSDRNFYFSENMGGLGASYISPYNINIVNPAALSHLRATSFDIGLYAERYGLRTSPDDPYTSLWSGNLSYLSLAVPLQNRLNDLLDRKERDIAATTAFTLLPYSVMGYNVATVDSTDADIGPVNRIFTGNGGTYQFTWSNSVSYKNFSFGANLSYLFGKLSYFNQLQIQDVAAAFITSSENTISLSGFQYNLGAIYTHSFNKKAYDDQKATHLKQLSIGLYGNTSTNYNSTQTNLNIIRQFVPTTRTPVSVDTLGVFEEVKGTGVLPSEIGIGITYYSGEKFGLGIDYARNDWSQFRGDFVNNPLKSTYKLSFGGYYRPKFNSITNYFSRVHYRFGVHYKLVPNEELAFNQGETIKDIGVNFGFGMPFFYQRKISHANLGVSAGMLGSGTAIEERYVKFTFSFTFNDDEWFIKRKYN